jgi:preprotein translocase subunit SecD
MQARFWRTWFIIGLCLLGALISLPNVLPESVRDLMKQAVVLPTQVMSLGLDLRGGSYLLLEVKDGPIVVERLKGKLDEARVVLRKAGIKYTGLSVTGDAVNVRILDAADYEKATGLLNGLAGSISNLLALGFGQKDLTVTQGADGLFTLKFTDPAIQQIRQLVIDQSVEIVRRRVDSAGTKEVTIQRQGANRILVQVPGVSDPKRLIELIGKTAKMTFHLVDETVSETDILANRVPPGSRIMKERSRGDGFPEGKLAIRDQSIITGDMLQKASGSFDQQTGSPIVSFSFNTTGARRFADTTRNNIGKRFAIVLDDEIISAPVIRSAIIGGSGQIEGGFTTQSANDLAILLNAGSLPAAISVEEQRTVGAELGADSVQAGQYAAIGGFFLVFAFMIVAYGTFGLFANVAMLANTFLLIAVMTIMQITLTLPGIAGAVLTMGMAVDANVLIYERMREEVRNGRTILSSIESGFERAAATITDSNLTTLLAGLILVAMASGPVRGFGITLAIGIVTSFFTAVYVTRLLVDAWYRRSRPTKLAM